MAHASSNASSLGWAAVSSLLRTLAKDLLNPYRPEHHYMRGPGPRWRTKHAQAATFIDSPRSFRLRPIPVPPRTAGR